MTLCGLKKPMIHISDGASFGLFDLEKKCFRDDNSMEVTEGYCIAGTYRNVPVSAAIGDNQASVLSALSDEKELLINVGPGSQVSVICDELIDAENIEMRPFFEGKYLAVGAALCGGRAYALLKNFYQSLLSMVAEVDDEAVYSLMAELLQQEGQTLRDRGPLHSS